MFGVPLTEMPTLNIVAVDELHDAAGVYDAADNTVKYIWDRDKVSPEERLGVTDAEQAAKISEYAFSMFLIHRFDEVEAEFEMKNALESAAMQRRIKRERRFE